MSEYTATVRWERGEAAFTDNRYSRNHELRFDGGVIVPGSASPHVVRVPLSDPSAVDPEESFVAALSACHMLWFLSIAAGRGFVVNTYHDDAVGIMSRNEQGQMALTQVTMRPATEFDGLKTPSVEEVADMHHAAHTECFIANSVRSEVRCEPTFTTVGR
jgi:organic hydroperoxide reductase OsmC/OhrA